MFRTVEKILATSGRVRKGDHLLVAVSGGPDSTVLLHLMTRMVRRHDLRLTAAHLNHALRGVESESDEAFVVDLCGRLGVACLVQRMDATAWGTRRGRSLEEVARTARYRFLFEAADRHQAHWILTGHHRDDQAETLLMNLLRGSGPDGLKGILPVRDGRILRPLLGVGRSEIGIYLERHRLPSVQDSSNRDPVFLRNRIRQELMPLLAAGYNPRFSQALARTAEIMRRESEYLDSVVQKLLADWGIPLQGGDVVYLPLKPLRELHEALQARIIRALAEREGSERRGLSYVHVDAVMQLVRQGRPSARLFLPGHLKAEREGDFLRLSVRVEGRGRASSQGSERGTVLETLPGELTIPASGRVLRVRSVDRTAWAGDIGQWPERVYMDRDCVRLPLAVRYWERGDRMAFLGMKGTKKLSDFFGERRIPRAQRVRIPLLVDADGPIWVTGERISERVKVSERTKNLLELEII